MASSASTILNSRATVEAYAVSESCEGRTAVPMSKPSRSAASRNDWAQQTEANAAVRITDCQQWMDKKSPQDRTAIVIPSEARDPWCLPAPPVSPQQAGTKIPG